MNSKYNCNVRIFFSFVFWGGEKALLVKSIKSYKVLANRNILNAPIKINDSSLILNIKSAYKPSLKMLDEVVI